MADPPRVGIVIPALNAGAYLREAIDSVLAQDWPHRRCLVMDGGSRDESAAILRSYSDRIEFVSEPDRGQAHAIQKGFDLLSDCDLVGWLNADDRLLPGALHSICTAAQLDPSAVLFHGDLERVDRYGRLLGLTKSVDVDHDKLRTGRGRVVQPGSFFLRSVLAAAGRVSPELHLLMDVDLWIRVLRYGPARRLERRLAQFRVHAASKSSQTPYRYYREALHLLWKHQPDRPLRALAGRMFGMARHYLCWRFEKWRGIAEPPPHEVLKVAVPMPLPTPAPLLALAEQGVIDIATEGVADVEVVLDARRRSRHGTVRSLFLLEKPGALPNPIDRHPGPAFIMCDSASRAALEGSSYPEFRVGDVRRQDAWRQALLVVAGRIPRQQTL